MKYKNFPNKSSCKRFYTDPDHLGRLPEIVKEISKNCLSGEIFSHIGLFPVPDKKQIISLIDLLKDILLPGYFGHQEICRSDLEYHIGSEIFSLFDLLSDQITQSIIHDCRRYDQECSDCQKRGDQEAVKFIEKIPELQRLLSLDIKAAYNGDPAAKSYDEIVFSYPCIEAIIIYRCAHELFNAEIPLLPRVMTEYAHNITSIDIHPGATIGESFFIDHGTGVVIGETTHIGKNVKIYQGVTLGALSFPKDEKGELMRGVQRHPTIEDDVVIYANATILGGDTVIGARSVVGGNVWVTESVPSDTKVLNEKSKNLMLRKNNE